MFNLSIKDNLTIGLKGISEENIKNMCVKISIYKEIQRMKNKYDTVFDESRTNLSDGQIKRLDIAISLLRNPKVLLLDEPLAPLDSKAQDIICSLIMKFNKYADAVYKFKNGQHEQSFGSVI